MQPNLILVLCTGNSCRSQMAEGYLRKYAGQRAMIYSAGVAPHGINPDAIAIMADDGVDISGHTSNHVDEYAQIRFDHVITVCDHAHEHCPIYSGETQRHHHDFIDPSKVVGSSDEIHEAYVSTRDAIKLYCEQFARTHLNI